ncbi:hypothetical protein [Xylanibacillus composti]|uniref:hypothetical protein n=1 Tax=Xylanibacillus composti TaxID=1572762 RepID=UPI001BCE9D2A|nr:hypothetical protein [Xylanibacillus composti]
MIHNNPDTRDGMNHPSAEVELDDAELYSNIEYWTRQEMAMTQVPRQNVFESAEETEE